MEQTTYEAAGLQMAALVAGEGGTPLFLVHGFTGCKEDFVDEIDPLAALGYHVVAPDLRGHGDTDFPVNESDYGLELFADDILALAGVLGWSASICWATRWAA